VGSKRDTEVSQPVSDPGAVNEERAAQLPRLQLADPAALSDDVRRASRGLASSEVEQARRIALRGGVASTPEMAQLVIALIAEDRRRNGSVALTLAITIGAVVWAIVRLASQALDLETWVVIAAAAVMLPSTFAEMRSRARRTEVERANAPLAQTAHVSADVAPLPLISLPSLLRRQVPRLIVSGLLFGLFLSAVNGHPITALRVLTTAGLWTVVMMLLMVWRAWHRARPERSRTGS
jgi:uncharacterized membrane protein YedE/YeeE